ncbi:MAG: hypothetical protein V1872_10820 [bacterium]
MKNTVKRGWKFVFFSANFLFWFFAVNHAVATTLQWSPNTQPDLDHYIVYWGNASGTYINNSGNIAKGTTIYNADIQGTAYCAVKSFDNLGKSSDYSNEVFVSSTTPDTIPPTSKAIPPVYGNNTLTIGWSASDDLSGVDKVELLYKKEGSSQWVTSGLAETGTTGGFFSFTPSDGEGRYYFATRATDKAGNIEGMPTDTGDGSTIYDLTPPNIPEITTNSGNNYTSDNPVVTLQGNCTSDTVAIYVNNSTIGVNYTPGETTWNFTGTLKSGDNTLNVTAWDAAGNASTQDSIIVSYTNVEDTTPPEIKKAMPPNNTGIDNSVKISTKASFYLCLQDTSGIDITNINTVSFTIYYDTVEPYTRNLGDNETVRVIKLTETESDSAVTRLWVAYDKSREPEDNVYPFDAVVTIEVNAEDILGNKIEQTVYQFKTKTEAQWKRAQDLLSTMVVSKGEKNISTTIQNGSLMGACVVYNNNEPVTPTFGLEEDVPTLDIAEPVGFPLNLEPPTIFNNPVTVFIPCPGYSDVSKLSVYYHDCSKWLLACGPDGIVQEGGDGWLVPGSRVNHNNGILSVIEIKIYHFSAIQAGLAALTSNDSTNPSDNSDYSSDDSGNSISGSIPATVNCFILATGIK